MKKMFGDSTKNEIIQELIDTNSKTFGRQGHKPAHNQKLNLREVI